ncbi:GEM-like protein 5 [Senna tora]|uniref:GEM-like protein 5 n=1 Tax=Senna tora TaxID=362788 RepID=A0A834WJP8_9FABA|nr:GEM-like protein 5 [Senna tora]
MNQKSNPSIVPICIYFSDEFSLIVTGFTVPIFPRGTITCTRDSNPPPVRALAVRFIFPHAAVGTDGLVRTAIKRNSEAEPNYVSSVLSRINLIGWIKKYRKELTILPDVVGGGFSLLGPGAGAEAEAPWKEGGGAEDSAFMIMSVDGRERSYAWLLNRVALCCKLGTRYPSPYPPPHPSPADPSAPPPPPPYEGYPSPSPPVFTGYPPPRPPQRPQYDGYQGYFNNQFPPPRPPPSYPHHHHHHHHHQDSDCGSFLRGCLAALCCCCVLEECCCCF